MLATSGFALFDTAIGRCGIAWSELGIAAVQLPEQDDQATRSRLLKQCANAVEAPPPPDVREVIEGITRLFLGEPVDLTSAVLDSDGLPNWS